MTNREYMQTLDDGKFEAVMHAIYLECICCRPGRIPTPYQVVKWLNKDKDKHLEFWNSIDECD